MSQLPTFWPPVTLTGLDQSRRCVRFGRGARRFGPRRCVVGRDGSRGVLDRPGTGLGRSQQCPPSLGTVWPDIKSRGYLGPRILASPRARSVPLCPVRGSRMGATRKPHLLRRVVRGDGGVVRLPARYSGPEAEPGQRPEVRDRHPAQVRVCNSESIHN